MKLKNSLVQISFLFSLAVFNSNSIFTRQRQFFQTINRSGTSVTSHSGSLLQYLSHSPADRQLKRSRQLKKSCLIHRSNPVNWTTSVIFPESESFCSQKESHLTVFTLDIPSELESAWSPTMCLATFENVVIED